MIVFYDPADGQVMALYTGDTRSREWKRRGFERASVPEALEAEALRMGRDAQATVHDGEVTALTAVEHPEQPQPSVNETRLGELRTKLGADTITDPEIREMLRLERGLQRRAG